MWRISDPGSQDLPSSRPVGDEGIADTMSRDRDTPTTGFKFSLEVPGLDRAESLQRPSLRGWSRPKYPPLDSGG